MSSGINYMTTYRGLDEDHLILTDFRAALAGIPSCVGVFKWDMPYFDLDGSNRIRSILNYKKGGPALVQSNAARRAYPILDPNLNRYVGEFRPAEQIFYSLDGFVFDSKSPWTMIAVAEPYYDNDFRFLAGAYEGGNNISGLALQNQDGFAPRVFRMRVGDATVLSIGRTGPNLIVAGSGSGVAKVPKISLNNGALAASPSGSTVEPTANTFYVSHPGAPFAGKVSFMALFTTELFLSPDNDATYNLVGRKMIFDRYRGAV